MLKKRQNKIKKFITLRNWVVFKNMNNFLAKPLLFLKNIFYIENNSLKIENISSKNIQISI